MYTHCILCHSFYRQSPVLYCAVTIQSHSTYNLLKSGLKELISLSSHSTFAPLIFDTYSTVANLCFVSSTVIQLMGFIEQECSQVNIYELFDSSQLELCTYYTLSHVTLLLSTQSITPSHIGDYLPIVSQLLFLHQFRFSLFYPPTES